MKFIPVIVIGLLLIIGTASAVTWTSSDGCWTATDGTYSLIMWNATGTSVWTVPAGVSTVEYLVLAGGGGGGGIGFGGGGSGGGGAGGLLNGTGLAVSGSETIVVGDGGAGGTAGDGGTGGGHGGNGGNSSLTNDGATILAIGGGGGAANPLMNGYTGGSGGGAYYTGTLGQGTLGQGYWGGSSTNSASYGGGGGGGKGSQGVNGTTTAGGNGGDGIEIFITGTSQLFAGGGGGGIAAPSTRGLGGSGIGGNGGVGNAANHTTATGYNATPFTGSGGGGAGSTDYNTYGGYGSSGVVIIRYQTPAGAIPPIVSFTSNVTSGYPPLAVQFNDTSSTDTLTWNWSYRNTTPGNNTKIIFSTDQNATITLGNGHWHIGLNVTNASGFNESAGDYGITVSDSGGLSGWNQQDVLMEGVYTLTINFQDSVSHAPIPVVLVLDSVGGNATTSTGTFTGSYNYSVVVIYASSDGYQSTSRSYVMDEDRTATVYMVRSSTSTNTSPVVNLEGAPKPVQFHIQSFWGAPIAGATVNVLGITTTTGSWDWVVQLLGIPLDEVPINGTAMTGTADTLGNLEFLMIPSAKYNVSVTAPGYTFPATIIAPHDSQYTIRANLNGTGWLETGNNTLEQVNITVTRAEINSTAGFINVTYNDAGLTTTGGTIKVYQDAVVKGENATLLATFPVTGNSFTNSTTVTVPQGGSGYTVKADVLNSLGAIDRTFATYFKGAPVQLAGLDPTILLWLSLFIVIFTAMFAGAMHAPQMSIIICIESWTFWIIGWLDPLVSKFGYGNVAIMAMLTFATFMAVLWNVEEGKRKGKRP